MFSPNAIPVEVEYKRQEMLRQAEQRRLIREIKQAAPRPAKHRLFLNALLTATRPVG